MAFESARLTRLDAPVAVEAIEARLAALPYAWRDPVAGRLFYLSGTAAGARAALAARIADPTRFPDGVLIGVERDGVGIDQRYDPWAMARARAFVAELLAEGDWTWRDEWGEHGPVRSADDLWPEPLPDPQTFDDPFRLPVSDGVVLRWRDDEGSLEVHSGGAVRWTSPDGRQISGALAPERLARWLAVPVDPDDFDFDVDEQGAGVRLDRDAPDDESTAFFRKEQPPDWAVPLAAEVAELRAAISGWRPGAPLPPGFAALSS